MNFIGKLWSVVKNAGKAVLNVANPQSQIQSMGSRRVWLSVVLTLLAMAFVIVSQILGIPNNVVLAALVIPGGLGGSFVVGESIRDNNAAKQNQNE